LSDSDLALEQRTRCEAGRPGHHANKRHWNKVLRSHLYPRDLTDPMRTPPSARVEQRALCGAWSSFPVSPQSWYDTRIVRFELKYRYAEDGWLAQEYAYRVAEWHDKKVAAAGADPARALARRRGGTVDL
jgi:hypothetical protein